jgi:hypothetical protein
MAVVPPFNDFVIFTRYMGEKTRVKNSHTFYHIVIVYNRHSAVVLPARITAAASTYLCGEKAEIYMANTANDQQLQALLQMVAQRLGTQPEKLKNAAEAGDVSGMFANMNPNDAAKLQQVLSDKDAGSKILSTPQAQQLLKKMMEGK